jgi:hypothetical protein
MMRRLPPGLKIDCTGLSSVVSGMVSKSFHPAQSTACDSRTQVAGGSPLGQRNAEAVRKLIVQARLPWLAEQAAADERWALDAIAEGAL